MVTTQCVLDVLTQDKPTQLGSTWTWLNLTGHAQLDWTWTRLDLTWLNMVLGRLEFTWA